MGDENTMKKKFHILILNGANLNLLGVRETAKYGNETLSSLIENLNQKAISLNVQLTHFQSNSESILIDHIHYARINIDYIIINPAAFTHTSIAIRDALLAVQIPFIEVHISNIYAREKFRQYSYLSDIASGLISGLGLDGYFFALQAAVKRLSNSIV